MTEGTTYLHSRASATLHSQPGTHLSRVPADLNNPSDPADPRERDVPDDADSPADSIGRNVLSDPADVSADWSADAAATAATKRDKAASASSDEAGHILDGDDDIDKETRHILDDDNDDDEETKRIRDVDEPKRTLDYDKDTEEGDDNRVSTTSVDRDI